MRSAPNHILIAGEKHVLYGVEQSKDMFGDAHVLLYIESTQYAGTHNTQE